MTKIYRSDSKAGLYVYLAENKKINDLDADLIKLLGKHTMVMELDLKSRDQLARQDIEKVKLNLKQQGYHVQLPENFVQNVLKYGK